VLIDTTLVHATQSNKGNVSEPDYTGQFAYNLRLQQDDKTTAESGNIIWFNRWPTELTNSSIHPTNCFN